MKLTVTTELLQSMVAKSMKGASCNKMIPITSFMAIELKNNELTLTTTDATNYLYIKESKIVGEDFYVVVQAEIFSKLISRLTCDSVTLELCDNCLKVKGNGSYSIELPLDEEGEPVKFTNRNILYGADSEEVNLSTIKVVLNNAKSALAVGTDVLCYMGYYAGDRVIATDTYKICSVDIKLFNEPALLSPETLELLSLMTDEKIVVKRSRDNILFATKNCVVESQLMDCIEDYQVEPITGLIEQGFESSCKLPKQSLLQLLDRLVLFVSPYDENGVNLTFTNKGLQVDSKQANSSELIEYTESSNFQSFTCCVDITMLASQIKSNEGDVVEICYGEDNAIKIVDGNITHIVALIS